MFWALGWIIPILIVAAVVYIVYLIVRSRREERNGFTVYQALMAYFYFVTAASFITMAVGMVYFIKVALSQAFDSGEIATDITLASALLVTGLVICALHVYGRHTIEKREEKATTTIRRIYLFFMLGTFGLTGLISLPLAIYQILRYYFVESHYHPRNSLGTASGGDSLCASMGIFYVPGVLGNEAKEC